MTDIDAAARATRKYRARWCFDNFGGSWVSIIDEKGNVACDREFQDIEESQHTCGRLNLVAVLEAIRDIGMVSKIDDSIIVRGREKDIAIVALKTMIDALIAEVKESAGDKA